MKYEYFISFAFIKGFGSTQMRLSYEINSGESYRKFQDEFSKMLNEEQKAEFGDIVILNITLLGTVRTDER